MVKRIIVLLSLVFFVFGSVGLFAEGQQEGGEKADGGGKSYPSRPIKVYVPYSAGGSSDLLARTINSVADKYFDQPLVIMNKTGGGGTIATE